MQSEIINEIIEVEDQATNVVEAAKMKASEIIGLADAQGKKIIKDAVKAKRLENQSKYDQLRKKDNEEVVKYEEQLLKSITVDFNDLECLAKKLADKICNTSVFEA